MNRISVLDPRQFVVNLHYIPDYSRSLAPNEIIPRDLVLFRCGTAVSSVRYCDDIVADADAQSLMLISCCSARRTNATELSSAERTREALLLRKLRQKNPTTCNTDARAICNVWKIDAA